MRRQKRDMFERAYLKGYRVGVSGRSKDLCPSEASQLHQEWINGWREGRSDHWEGYVGVSGIHKTPDTAP